MVGGGAGISRCEVLSCCDGDLELHSPEGLDGRVETAPMIYVVGKWGHEDDGSLAASAEWLEDDVALEGPAWRRVSRWWKQRNPESWICPVILRMGRESRGPFLLLLLCWVAVPVRRLS